jgi:transcription elongation factor GreA
LRRAHRFFSQFPRGVPGRVEQGSRVEREVILTPSGYEKLKAQIEQLQTVERRRVADRIREAREFGDISENSEYDDAKERQSHCEGRIQELEHRLATAEVIDVTRLPQTDRVVFGATVKIENTVSGETRTWRIVGEDEADVEKAKISYKSPLGKSLIGRRAGEEAVVTAPSGNQTWEIVEVHYR